jgi:uncharacterized protein YfaS (alpha-2-macroglobulin family)
VGHGSLSGVSRGEAGAMGPGEARVRHDFPETMLWRPQVLTDAQGNATIEMTMADSITTWRLGAEAIAADGRLGVAWADVRVFQDFFVDLDLPAVATQHDELAVPVAVYNYLAVPQRVTLALDDGAWFQRLGDRQQSIDLAPSQVGVRYFRIRIGGLGRQKLLVRARGSATSDAVERSLEVFPDGVERAVSVQDRIGAGSVQQKVDLPKDLIASTGQVELKVYPGMASHVMEGLDSMLRMPGGCFEQTSSTNYPNALILDYLRRTAKSTPAVEKKAHDYLAQGYQRLLSFEVRGGGFSWFGEAPANQILTAYGLEEFHDMARVFAVDQRVIERTQSWLVAQQRPDGSWAPDKSFINEGATNHFNSDVVRITAYVALALRRTGAQRAAVEKAMTFVRRQKAPTNPYSMALVVELLGEGADRLWEMRRNEGRSASFVSQEKTPTYGDGKSGAVETTAVAAYALLSAPGGQLARVDQAIAYLIGNKDSFGNWYSTQATIRSLKTLLAYQAKSAQRGKGTLTVTVDGKALARVTVDGLNDALQVVDLPGAALPGGHAVELRYQGTGQVAYQLVSRYWEPHRPAPPAADFGVATQLDASEVKPGQDVRATVRVQAREAVDMPIVTAGIPPGFDVDVEELDRLVRERKVEKVQRTPREVVFYLRRLEGGQPMTLPVRLTARFPLRVQVPAPTAYEYYRPERRTAGRPLVVSVRG